MKTKIIALLLALVLMGTSAIVLSSCGNSDSNGNEELNNGFEWPDSDLAALLPNPEAKSGKVTYESSTSLDVEIYNFSSEDYQAYVKKCKESGFDKDYTSWEDYFSADNKDDYSLTVDYEKEKQTMSISLYAPSDDETEETKESKSSKTSSKVKTASKSKSSSKTKSESSKVSADFKKTMDEYESFMDEYVDFMKKYNNSTDVAGMLTEYSEMMSKYNEFTQKIDDIDEDSLSTADAAYYLEVTARVTKKLAEIS